MTTSEPRAQSGSLRGVGLAAVLALLIWWVRPPLTRASDTRSLAVEPLLVLGAMPAAWNSHRFTDSLLVALGLRLEGPVEREVIGRTGTMFVLGGSIEMRLGRLVINTSLRRRADSTVVWGATFWRDSAGTNTIIDEVADGVVQAMRQSDTTPAHPASGGDR